ncbi:MAG: hypothetical protein MK098_08375 [Marinovum sp.]|nr:hypothetical protein [Marinovum sp.]
MEFLLWIGWVALTVIPLMKLLPHFGIEKWWALASVLPIGTLILLWIMAMKLQELEQR